MSGVVLCSAILGRTLPAKTHFVPESALNEKKRVGSVRTHLASFAERSKLDEVWPRIMCLRKRGSAGKRADVMRQLHSTADESNTDPQERRQSERTTA